MRYSQWTWLLAGIMIASVSQAEVSNHAFVGLQLGAGYNHIRANTLLTAPVPGSDPQRYNTDGGSTVDYEAGIRTGLQTVFNAHWSLQWALGYYHSLAQKLTGNYYALNSTPADLTYRSKLHAQRVMFEPRLYYQHNNHWSYFAGLNFGVALLHTSKTTFSTIAYPSGSTQPLDAYSKMQTNFAYGVSVGVDYRIQKHWHLALGLSQLWLGRANLSVNNGVDVVKVKAGNASPTLVWLAGRYQF